MTYKPRQARFQADTTYHYVFPEWFHPIFTPDPGAEVYRFYRQLIQNVSK